MPPVGKSGPGHDLEQLVVGQLGVVDQLRHRVAHLDEVVRRHVGGHAHRDPGGAVAEKIGEAAGEHHRLLAHVLVVGPEVDGLPVDLREHLHADRGQARLGIPLRRRRVAVHAAEVPLAVHQRVAQREALGKPHHREVDRRGAVRMVVAVDVAGDLGALAIRLVRREVEVVHRDQNPALHRLHAVPHIGKRPVHDDRHRVIEIRGAHLIFNGRGNYTLPCFVCHHNSLIYNGLLIMPRG